MEIVDINAAPGAMAQRTLAASAAAVKRQADRADRPDQR